MLDPTHPVWRHPIEFDEAPVSSDQGLPIGNGLVGASIWGKGVCVYLSLDRSDLWDLRPIPEYQGQDYRWDYVAAAHHAGEHDKLKTLLEAPYDRAGPTRLSAGRLELTFESPPVRWRLERATGLARIDFANGTVLQALIPANGSLGRLKVTGQAPVARLITPPFGGPPEGLPPPSGFNLSQHNAWDLGYPPPQTVSEDRLEGFLQQGFGDFAFTAVLATESTGETWNGVWCIDAGTSSDVDFLRNKIATARSALAHDYDNDAFALADWWADYWSRGRVCLPEAPVERTYYAGMSQFGAAARRDRPPVSLQGVWTSDSGRLPPWKGDYHHDLNTQMTYWPAYAGDQLEGGLGFLDWLWETREACQAWTLRFFGVDGLNVPMTADIANRQIGGWRQYTHSVSTSAWLAHHFCQHWRYSQDRQFLADRAYPYLNAVCRFVEAISEKRDAKGFRSVALSSSPEVGDNQPQAWFSSWTNYDLTLFRWVLGATAEMAQDLSLPAEADHWRRVLSELPEASLSDSRALLVAPGLAYPGHHRHFSHAVGVHPLGLYGGLEGSAEDQTIALGTFQDINSASGDFWMGYSHAWAAAIAARVGNGEAARRRLLDYAEAFVFPNGFHANGDWQGLGRGKAPFGAFSIEGAMGASDAIQTMLLQSTSGRIRLFPALPDAWSDASFDGLRADGAVLVSAAIEAGRLTRVTLAPQASGRIRFAFGTREPALELELVKGTIVDLSASELARLEAAPPRPN